MAVDTEKLRVLADYLCRGCAPMTARPLRAAADEIDALRAEVERLRARLSMASEFSVGHKSIPLSESLRVVRRPAGLLWAVVHPQSGYELNNKGWWEYNPGEGTRADYTLDEALDAARALVEPQLAEPHPAAPQGVEDNA